jgi:hypothetical protein
MRRRSRSDFAWLWAALAAGGALALASRAQVPSVQTFLTFAGFIAVTGLLDVELPSGPALSLSLAPALGLVLLRECAGGLAGKECVGGFTHQPGEIALVFLTAGTLAVTLRLIMRRDSRIDETTSRLLLVIAATALYRALSEVRPATGIGPTRVSALGLAGMLALVLVWEAGFLSFRLSIAGIDGRRVRPLDTLVSIAPLEIALVSIGALLALAYPVVARWSLPLFLVPLAATQYAFRQFASIRKTYVQTVGALAKVPEMAGYTQPGHSRRVADLAVAMAERLAASDARIRQIEYAALLHDIGRVSLEDPEKGQEAAYRLQLALVGAGIVEQTGHFPEVATLIRSQHEPYRRRGEETNHTLPLGAKIIKVASAYDDYTTPGGPGRGPWDAVERLHLGMAYEFDPMVIQALTRVLEQRGEI